MTPISERPIRNVREVKGYEREYLENLVKNPNDAIALSAQDAMYEIEQTGGTSLSPEGLLYMGNEHGGT